MISARQHLSNLKKTEDNHWFAYFDMMVKYRTTKNTTYWNMSMVLYERYEQACKLTDMWWRLRVKE